MIRWLFLATLLVARLCPAADYPVASVDGFKSALAGIQPGDTITLREGEWRDADLIFEGEGTEEQPVVLRAAVPGKTVLTGRSRLRIAGRHLTVSGLFFRGAWHKEDLVQFRRDSKFLATGCRLTGCALVDCNAPEGKSTTRWVGLYGERNRVDHCWFQGKTSPGTTLVVWLEDRPAEHRIDHNYFGPRPELKKNGGETIRLGDSKTSMQEARCLVEANAFEACNGEAEIISNKSCGNIYRGNVFLRCSGALTLRHGNGCLVEGNCFFGEGAKGTGGVRVIGERHRVENNYFQDLAGEEGRAGLCLMNGQEDSPLHGYFPVRGAQITGNTWVNCRQPIYIGLTDEDAGNAVPVRGVVFSRNLISGEAAAVTERTPGEVQWTENVVSPAAAPATAIPGLRALPVELKSAASGVCFPAPGSAAAGYGCDLGGEETGRQLPALTGPDWRLAGKAG